MQEVYLTARRIVRAISRIQKQLERRQEDMEEGWNERDALHHWAEVCGPTRMDIYLLKFLRDEIALSSEEQAVKWQKTFSHLISVMLRQGMPMEKIEPSLKFYEANRRAIHAEELLLAVLNACSLVTEEVSSVDWPFSASFGNWLGRLQGQRVNAENVVSLHSLGRLDLSDLVLVIHDLSGADLREADLSGADLVGADLREADLSGATLSGADLREATLSRADLSRADLVGADLGEAALGNATLRGATLRGANLSRATLRGANLSRADLVGADLGEAALVGADLSEAALREANLIGAALGGAALREAALRGAALRGADLIGAALSDATLSEARFGSGFGLSESAKEKLKSRGVIFAIDRSKSE